MFREKIIRMDPRAKSPYLYAPSFSYRPPGKRGTGLPQRGGAGHRVVAILTYTWHNVSGERGDSCSGLLLDDFPVIICISLCLLYPYGLCKSILANWEDSLLALNRIA